MITYKIYQGINLVFSIILLPLQLLINLCLNLLSNLGLLFVPILACLSLIYILLLGVVLAASWVCKYLPVLTPFVSIIGIPAAILAQFVVTATPALDGLQDRFKKLIVIDFYPYSLDMFLMIMSKGSVTEEIKEIYYAMNNPALEPIVAEEIARAERRK